VAASEAARAGIAQRLCNLINKKLDQMEKDMDSGALGSSDLEHTKSVGAMMSGMDLTPADADKKQKTKDGAAPEVDTCLDDYARLQRKIIERFERRREAARGSE
jgi:hypothetical protein